MTTLNKTAVTLTATALNTTPEHVARIVTLFVDTGRNEPMPHLPYATASKAEERMIWHYLGVVAGLTLQQGEINK